MSEDDSITVTMEFALPAPFVDATTGADIVLRSNDGHQFFVHSTLLSLSSSVFRDMLRLPQTPAKAGTQLHEVALPESAKTILLLLRWVDPRCDVPDESIDDLASALDATEKYQMKRVEKQVWKALESMIPREPVRIYFIAILHKNGSIARQAAEQSLQVTLQDPSRQSIPELKQAPALALQRLLDYHSACIHMALQVRLMSEEEDHPQGYCHEACMPRLEFSPEDNPYGVLVAIDNGYQSSAMVLFKNAIGARLSETPHPDCIKHITFHSPNGVIEALRRDCKGNQACVTMEKYFHERELLVGIYRSDLREALLLVKLVID